MGKDVVILWQNLQCIILCIHPYRVHILYMPGPELFIVDWLSWHNHEDSKDKEIQGLSINVNVIETAVDLPVCTSICDIQETTARDAYLQKLKAYIIKTWPHKKKMLLRHTIILAYQGWLGHDI